MYTYPLITYGGGETLALIFNGIATCIGDSNYISMIRIFALFGLFWALVESTFKQSFAMNVRWLVGFILLYNVLLVPKVTVHIIDRVHQNQLHTVDHVPWGLAMFASLSSEIGDNLTRLTEKVFSLPDDLKYSKTGTVMASNIIIEASRFHITNPDFSQNMREYMQQCVFYDVLLGKFALRDLIETPDLWTFLQKTASPARAFVYMNTDHKGQILTCFDGIKQLNGNWKDELQQSSLFYGTRLFPYAKTPLEAKAQLLSYLNNSYSYLTKVSDDAANLIQQNMLANSIEQSLLGQGASINAPAAVHAYALTRANEMKRTTYEITGELAARWLPLMKNVFEALLYGSFLFIFLVTLLPMGASIFQNYILALFWIQSWAPLYAILNLIMTLDAKSHSLAVTSFANDTHTLTFSNISSLSQINADTAALAGYLSMSIPFIAYSLVRGGASAFSHLASNMGGTAQSAASTAAQEASTGNFSLGNTHFSTHTANNTSANHLNTNASIESGMTSYQTDTGAMIHHTPGGYDVIDNRGTTISHTATSVNLADSLRASATQQYEQALTHAQHSAQNYSNSVSTAIRDLYDLSLSQGHSISSDETSTLSESASISKNIHTVKGLTERFATEHGVSTTQATQLLGTAFAEVKMGIPIAGGGAKGEIIGTSSANNNDLHQAAKQFMATTDYSENLEHALRGIHDQHYRVGTEEGQRAVTSLNNSMDQANTFRHETSLSLQNAESYRKMTSLSQEQAASINQLANQEFVEWMRQQPSPGTTNGKMDISTIEMILNHDPELARIYANQFIKEQSSHILSQWNHTPQEISHDYSQNEQQFKNSSIASLPQPSLPASNENTRSTEPSTNTQVTQLLSDTTQTISKNDGELDRQGTLVKNEVLSQIDTHKQGLLSKALEQTYQIATDTLKKDD